jgi:hypothetical protein
MHVRSLVSRPVSAKKLRLQDCPVVRSDKREQSKQMLKSVPTENLTQGVASPPPREPVPRGGGDRPIL